MSYALSGTNQWLNTSTIPVSGPPLTIAIWYKQGETGVVDTLVNLGASGDTNNCYQLNRGSANSINAAVRDGTTTYNTNTANSTTDTAGWHLAVGVWLGTGTSSTDRKSYLDADEANVGTNTTDYTINNASWNQFRIGTNASDAQDFTGKIAHVAVWDVELTTAQIDALYAGDNPLTVQATDLIAYWPLTADANDVVGTNHLTVTGATVDTGDNPTVNAASTVGTKASFYRMLRNA